MSDSADGNRSAWFKGVAILAAVTLAAAPLGFGNVAYGAAPIGGAQAATDEGVASDEGIVPVAPDKEAPSGERAGGVARGEAAETAGQGGDATPEGSIPGVDPAPEDEGVPGEEVEPDASGGDGTAPDEGVEPDADADSDKDVDPDKDIEPDAGVEPDGGVAPDEDVEPDDGEASGDGAADGSDDGAEVDPGGGSADDPNADGSGAETGDPATDDAIADPADVQPAAPPANVPDGAFASPSASGPLSTGTTLPSSGTYTPRRAAHDLTTEKFVAVIGEQARQVGQERDLYASVMIAQAILESGSGNSKLAQAPHHNLFGIKGSWKGRSVSLRTMEDDGTGLYFAIIADFRAYDSITDSLEDYADLLRDGMSGYYRGAWKSNATTPAQACDFLQGRYATSTSYSASLQDLIATYDLTRFDEPLDYELTEPCELPVIDEETGQVALDDAGDPVREARTLADLVAESTSHLGTDYVWGGASPETGFDCSGLVQYAYREALGVDLPRTTYGQWRVGETVAFDDLRMGDLLFFEREGNVHHVALYLGDGYYLHAPQTGDVVKVTSMEEYAPSFAQRIVETRPVEDESGAGVAVGVEAEVAADVEGARA